MASTQIILRNSGVTGNVPTVGNLEFGEIALNYTDKKIFFKDSTGAIQTIQTPTDTYQALDADLTAIAALSSIGIAKRTGTNTWGLGVVSLASEVSGTLPVTNGGSGVTTSTGSGNNVLSASPTLTGTPLAPTAAANTNTTQIATTAFVQQELQSGSATASKTVTYVRNQTGSTIIKGSLVYISGATGSTPLITKAMANAESTSARTLGMVSADITNNGFGYVITHGNLSGLLFSAINDSGVNVLAEGTQIFLSSTVAGKFSTTEILAPAHLVYIGIVTGGNSGASSNGELYLSIQNGYELDELHNVAAASAANGDVIRYNTATSLWESTQPRVGVTAPANATSTGTAGQIAFDTGFVYICTATNTWKRSALTTW